jgi:hypothetical protein
MLRIVLPDTERLRGVEDLYPIAHEALEEAWEIYGDDRDAAVRTLLDYLVPNCRELPTVFEMLSSITTDFTNRWLEDQYIALYVRLGPWFSPEDRERFGLTTDVLQLANVHIHPGARHRDFVDEILDAAEAQARKLKVAVGIENARPGFAHVLEPRGYMRLTWPGESASKLTCWLKHQP